MVDANLEIHTPQPVDKVTMSRHELLAPAIQWESTYSKGLWDKSWNSRAYAV